MPSVVMETWLGPLLSAGEFRVLVLVEETLIVLAVTMTNSNSISSTFRNVGEESTKGSQRHVQDLPDIVVMATMQQYYSHFDLELLV